MWLEDITCATTVSHAWNLPTYGSPLFQIHSKTKNVRKVLKRWNSSQFGNCHLKIKELKEKISHIQQVIPLLTLQTLITVFNWSLMNGLRDLICFGNRNLKKKWLCDGHANTKFFHLTTIIDARYNKIVSVKNLNHISVFKHEEIGDCFVNYYNSLFTSDHSDNPNPFPSNLENLFPKIISDDENSELCKIPTPFEIKNVMFFFASNKSPGPDGHCPIFYKAFWKTTNKALTEAVQYFFKTGHLLKAKPHFYCPDS